jgi:recombination protein RecT
MSNLPIHQQIAAEAGIGSVKRFFESQKSTLLAVLPQHVSADRMLKLAIGALRTTPKLQQCTIESLFGALVQCSQLGLEPNTPLGYAFLIPFENRRLGKTEVQIVFGYKGLLDLARRSGQIVSIAAHEVCENDHFEFEYGLDEKLSHRPAMLKPRGEVVAFYAVAKLAGGGHAFEVMSVSQVEAIRDSAQNYKFAKDKEATVWGKNFVEMGRKTVLRRLMKYLPVGIELATAVALDSKSEDESQNLGAVLSGDFEVVDSDGVITTIEEPEKSTVYCSDAEFAQRAIDWRKAIEGGRFTADALVTMITGKMALTSDQISKIKSWSNAQ